MTKSIYHPVPPTGCKLSPVVPTNFLALFSEVSRKDEYARTETREGLGLLCDRRNNEMPHFFLFNNKTRRIIDFLNYNKEPEK